MFLKAESIHLNRRGKRLLAKSFFDCVTVNILDDLLLEYAGCDVLSSSFSPIMVDEWEMSCSSCIVAVNWLSVMVYFCLLCQCFHLFHLCLLFFNICIGGIQFLLVTYNGILVVTYNRPFLMGKPMTYLWQLSIVSTSLHQYTSSEVC